MDARSFESTLAAALAAHLGADLERFSLRREVAGAVDAVAQLRGDLRPQPGPAGERHPDFESLRFAGSRVTGRLGAETLVKLAAAVEQAHTLDTFGGDELHSQAVLIDYCDPNATKPLHLGHLRNLAIGAGLTRLLAFAGATVSTQSVLGDIGRNVAEAMAGVELFGAQGGGGKADHWVGGCYARYVREFAVAAPQGAAPDAPIERELQAHGDRADRLLGAWLGGDPTTLEAWRSLVDGVAAGQAQTLARLSVAIERVLLESEGALLAPAWLDSAVAAGAAVRRADGAVVFETGRDSYPALLLARADGVPTEHLRALPLWARLQPEGKRLARCFHVMGAEWLVTTELREDLIRRLGPAELYERYVKLAHGFVTVSGSKMKSSDGQALTIDEALDRLGAQDEVAAIVARSGGLWSRDAVAAALMCSTLQAVALAQPCEIDPDAFVTLRAHRSGSTLLHAALALAGPGPDGDFRPAHAVDRHFVLQAARLPGFVNRALASGDLYELLRFIGRVAQQVVEHRPGSRAATYAARWILGHGLKTLGLPALPRGH
ncbi:arginine--tRNA ligase domain-containing protein [Rubrivivax gelatinosus]|uniref:Arginine--tRNA ligase n=1 Tax=Rubrivivax gelatinosus TaxID=28068 RepID=A0A4R2LYH0_RUBGE|nr:arginine--tRNA ligase [Rubrivivax gelatinosus]TCO99718.1 arginyl-tRNA synthetase [Rubrivivax gelatinosus]